jgi:hypothetical protein
MDKRYIKFFDGYRAAYGLADFEHKEAKVDPESGKKKPVYRWNYEPLTEKVYQSHLEGKISIGIQPCNENKEARLGVIDVDPTDYDDFNKKFFIDVIQDYDLPLIPVESKSGGLHLCLFIDNFIWAKDIVSFLINILPLFKLKPNNEIFPKQTELTRDGETGRLKPGQFINLPYYGGERKALNVDGTPFTFEKFLDLVDANLVSKDQLNIITKNIDKKIYEGVSEDFIDGPPCLADISKVAGREGFDGKDRFMYNYHVLVKMKYPDGWEQKVKNAPVRFFEEQHANAWTDQKLKSKITSWSKSEKGYTCNEDPLWSACKKGICVKKKFGVLSGSKGSYPVLTNLRKIEIFEEPEYEFDVIKPDGISKVTVHCRSVEHLNDQIRRRNSISKAAGFLPPRISIAQEQIIMDALYETEQPVQPPIGTSPKEKLHDVLHAKINGPRATNDAAFKSGSVLIEGEYAFFKLEKFFDRLKAKDWKYKEEKTGRIMEHTYRECEIEFLEQKRFPTKEKGKHNSSTKNVVKIHIKSFEEVPIHHTKTKHKTEIM